jgi:NADH-quinone oxidoreductase subunit M
LILFYVFFEGMLVPMYALIGVWGGANRRYAALKFFLYTLFGGLLMLVAILYLYFKAGATTFDYETLRGLALTDTEQIWLFLAFFVAFAIKVPLFPFHTWLPDAHTEAPTIGSVDLAAILLKIGGYGIIRFALPYFPVATQRLAPLIIGLAVVGVLYGALVAMVQPDIKKLVAYSSVSHLGFVMLGIWGLSVISVQGALMVMISHGISTGALFLMIGMIYERRHSRMIADYGGIARVVPLFSLILTVVALSSIGLPGLNGFVGEFLVLLGSFPAYPWATGLATTGVIFAAAYLLWALQRMIFNRLDNPENERLTDLTRRELVVLLPLIVGIVWLGLFPGPVLRRMEPATQRFVETVQAGRPNAMLLSEQGRR